MVQVNRPSFIVKEARGNISRALSNRGPKSSPKVLWGTAYKDNEFQNAVTFVSEKEDSTGKLFNAILKNCQVQFDCWKNGIPEIFEFPVNKTINWMVFEQISGSLYVLDQSAHSYTDQDPIETWDSIRGSNLSLALHNIERAFDGFIAGNFLRKQETFEEMPVLGILCRCVIQLSKRYATKSLENQCVTSDDRSCYEIMTEDLEIAKANRLAPIAKRPVAGEEEDATAE